MSTPELNLSPAEGQTYADRLKELAAIGQQKLLDTEVAAFYEQCAALVVETGSTDVTIVRETPVSQAALDRLRAQGLQIQVTFGYFSATVSYKVSCAEMQAPEAPVTEAETTADAPLDVE